MEKMSSINFRNTTEDLRNVFGSSYITLGNIDEIKNNYYELKALKEKRINEIINFIIEDNPRKVLTIPVWELDLLLLSSYENYNKEEVKFYTYYSLKDLDFIKILKRIGLREEISTEDDDLLYRYIRNQKTIDDLKNDSTNGEIAFTLQTLNILYRLITSKHSTVGHNIKAYERLCTKLNLSKYLNGPHLELKPSIK